MPPIHCGDDLPKAPTHEEKCEALRNELYQAPCVLPDQEEADLFTRDPQAQPYIPITDNEIEEALNEASNTSAPGYSQISYQVLKWAWIVPRVKTYISALIKKCLQAGYHPTSWRKAIAVALQKPGKWDPSKPRLYHLITLLKCMGKLLEKIVARQLTYQ
ncbi:hypothetical protein L218DRAFT_884000, partial [Marasmius fiardii PR-910]